MASSHTTSSPANNASRMQKQTRELHNFSSIEDLLPAGPNGASGSDAHGSVAETQAGTTGTVAARVAALSQRLLARPRVASLLSYLGSRKPAEKELTAEDSVWLLDNIAFWDPSAGRGGSGAWRAEFVAAVMARKTASEQVVNAVRDVADALRHGDAAAEAADDATLATIEARLLPFLQDIRPGKVVMAQHGQDDRAGPATMTSSWLLRLGPGSSNGLSSDVCELPVSTAAGEVVPTRAMVPAKATGLLEMQTLFAADGGWGVISDIDDTIKITQTSDPVGILQKTFVDPPEPVPGMPDLYAALRRHMGTAAPFFYLSASPYNLYPFLQAFRKQFYPDGALILRDASLASVRGLLATLTLDTQTYKVNRMHKVHGWLPRTAFVCIGDSTQSDPEAYGEIFRTYPGWVKLILIRKVTDIAALGITEKNEPGRFEKAFHDVPKTAWHVFEDPAECFPLVQAAMAKEVDVA